MARLAQLQNTWKRGMKQDIPRTEMPAGSAWNLVDFIPELTAPLEKRGGWAYGSGTLIDYSGALVTATSKIREGQEGVSASSYTTTNFLAPQVDRLYLVTVMNVSHVASASSLSVPQIVGPVTMTWTLMKTQTSKNMRLTTWTSTAAAAVSGVTPQPLGSGRFVLNFFGRVDRYRMHVDEISGLISANPLGDTEAASASAGGSSLCGTVSVASTSAGDAVWMAAAHDQNEHAALEAGWMNISDSVRLTTGWNESFDSSPSASWATTANWAMFGFDLRPDLSTRSPNYPFAVHYAPFEEAPRLCVVADVGVLYTVDLSSLDTSVVGFAPVSRQITFHRDTLILTDDAAQANPRGFDGSNIADLGGSPPPSRYACTYADRTILASSADEPNRVRFSDPGDPNSYNIADSWIDVDQPITGVAALPGSLMVFQSEVTTRLRGVTPPPGTDMIADDPIFRVGCTDARSIASNAEFCCFCNPAGVYLTNGTNLPTDITQLAGVKAYWQGLFQLYDPDIWTIAGELYRRSYVVSVMNGATFVDAFCFDLDTFNVWRVSNLPAVCFAPTSRITEELWFGLRNEAKLGRFSPVFLPSADNKEDANGVPVLPVLETQLFGANPAAQKTWRSMYLEYDVRDAASDDPGLVVAYAKNPEDGYTTLRTLAETANRDRSKVVLRFASDGLAFRLEQQNASATTRIYDISADVHLREASRLTQ